MRKMKKMLALLLVLCMTFQTTLSAAAAEVATTYTEATTEASQNETTTAEAVTTEETTTAEVVTTEGTTTAESVTTEETTEAESASSAEKRTTMEATTTAEDATTENARNVDDAVATFSTTNDNLTGTTQGNPFSQGTAGSTNFRIPALITLSNGWMLGAADARWGTISDGYGLDTIVSLSKDNGSTWNYSLPNYFNDSNGYDGSASAFIDPVLVQGKDDTVYLFADLYPGGGRYIANIKSGTGFVEVDGTSYLALYSSSSASSSNDPSYYVDNELNSYGYYKVYNYSNKAESCYALDTEYNIYKVSNGKYEAVTGTQINNSSTTINANVFYTGTANESGLYVLGTEYIVMRKGTVTDDGIVWGNLELLNVKNGSEYFYGFGPGGGICTSTGRIIVPLYTYANGKDGKTSVIYSDDNGKTWTRSADMNMQTSEASISEVVVNGTNYLYMFTRHGGYFVSEDDGATWSAQKSVSGVSYLTDCELSTLTYSKLIDDCPAILLCAPTGNGRYYGKIIVGLVQTDGSIDWKYTYQVTDSSDSNNGRFQYSDMTELSDGSIGLLYENGGASITYEKLEIKKITGENAVISNLIVTPKVDDHSNIDVSVSGNNIKVKSYDDAANGINSFNLTSNESCTWTSSDESVIKLDAVNAVQTQSVQTTIASVTSVTATVVGYGTSTITATGSSGDVVTYDVKVYEAYELDSTEDVSLSVGETSKDYGMDDTTKQNGTYTSSNGTFSYTIENNTSTTGVTIEKATSIKSGSKYLITVNGNVVTNNDGSGASGGWNTAVGLYIQNLGNISSDNYNALKNYMWTITQSDNGYTVKDTNDEYMTIAGANNSVTLSSTVSNLTIEEDDSSFKFSNGKKYYLNNFGGGNTFASSYMKEEDAKNAKWTLYEVKEITTDSQVVNFTGLVPGKETIDIGNTRYTITVTTKEASKTLYLPKGNTVTLDALSALGLSGDYTAIYVITDGKDYISLTNNKLIAKENGTAVVTATVKRGDIKCGTVTYMIKVADYVTSENTPFVVGSNTVATGQGKILTKLTLSVGLNYDVDLANNYTGGNWSIGDTNIATVDSNGKVTGAAVGETTLTWTDGSGNSYSIPVVVVQNTTSANTKLCSLHISGITNTTTWYSWNCSGDTEKFVEAIEGEAIYVSFASAGAFCINFYAKPNDGYALTAMSATNSASDYYALNGNSAIETDFYNDKKKEGSSSDSYGAAMNERNMEAFGDKKVENDIAAAMKLECDGAHGFSRGTDSKEEVNCDLIYYSEKLPEMYKVLTGVTHDGAYKPYTENMTVDIGDTLHYTIYVNVPTMAHKDSGSISYTKFTVTDSLTDAKWEADDLNSENPEEAFTYKDGTDNGVSVNKAYYAVEDGLNSYAKAIKNEAQEDGSVHLLKLDSFEYETSDGSKAIYKDSVSNVYAFHTDRIVTAGDINADGKIVNIATLAYNYQGLYSSSSKGADADANIKVTIEAMEYVIDFGLPVTIDLKNKLGGETIKSVDKVNYGIVAISDSKQSITYTPQEILTTSEYFEVTCTNGTVLRIRIYPATSVYYEEEFLNYGNVTVEKKTYDNDGWESVGTKVSNTQKSAVLGKDINNYGYDEAYSSVKDGSYMKSTKKGAYATFTFTGTGFQLYANSDKSSGYVTVYREGELSKLYMINTVLSARIIDATNNQSGDATYYNLPIISETALPYGTYTVQIKQTKDAPIYIDGVRILGTMEDSSIYKEDLEDNPSFYELRDCVLQAAGVETLDDNTYIGAENRDGKVAAVKDMAGQVYNSLADQEGNITEEALIFNGDNSSLTVNQLKDLLDNGPKNELYLYSGQSLTFKVKTNRVMQLGLKSPTGSAMFTLKVNGTESTKLTNLSTTVDMFYPIVDKADEETEYVVTIAVKEGPLSVTQLKICDDSDFAFSALTKEDIENLLLDMYGLLKEEASDGADTDIPVNPEEGSTDQPTVEPSKPGDTTEADKPDGNTTEEGGAKDDATQDNTSKATLTIHYVTTKGKKVDSVSITKDGKTGEMLTYTAKQVKQLAKNNLPKGYVLRLLNTYKKVQVKYGDSASIKVKVVKVTAPKKVSLKKVVSAKKKQMTISWKKVSNAAGYKIYYSTDKTFQKNVKTVTVKGNKTFSKKIKGLKAGKTYYVKVRAYKKAQGQSVEGSYSKTTTVKIKKK